MLSGIFGDYRLEIPPLYARQGNWITVAGLHQTYVSLQKISRVEYYRDPLTNMCTDIVFVVGVRGRRRRYVEFSLDGEGNITEARVERQVFDSPDIATAISSLDGSRVTYDQREYQFVEAGETEIFVLDDSALALTERLEWVAFATAPDHQGIVRKLVYARPSIDGVDRAWQEVYSGQVCPKEYISIYIPIIYS